MEFESQTFDTASFLSALGEREPTFEDCEFAGCVVDGATLNAARFVDCRFSRCALLNVRVDGVAFRDVTFQSSKLQGLDFGRCSPALFEVRFDDSSLSYCAFQSMDARRTTFSASKVEESEFVRVDLRKVAFTNTSLRGTRFEGCNLSGTDLRSAEHYMLDPSKNRMDGARVSMPWCASLLLPFGIKVDGVGR